MEAQVRYDPRINHRQMQFHACGADEVVYGGAKGGGKSCALTMEAAAWGFEHEGANMYLFRENYDMLESTIIAEWKSRVPAEAYKYNESRHTATLPNGTVVHFRSIRNYADAQKYAGRSMDWVGIDELTKHEKRSVQEIMSCMRSIKGYRPKFRGTCNPGGIGHQWVKDDYIIATDHGEKIAIAPESGNTRAFIPARVYDNTALMRNDPAYAKRLENLPEARRKAFLEGDWDSFDGQFFSEFSYDVHVVKPFVIPGHWRIYTAMDYGQDMLANYWFAMDPEGKVYIYKEVYKPGLIISAAAKELKRVNGNDDVHQRYGPEDLFGTSKDTGITEVEQFRKNGWPMRITHNKRVHGWQTMREWLAPFDAVDVQTGKAYRTAKMVIFSTCTNLIRTLPQLQYDDTDPNDAATEPHEITHAPDAIRTFCMGRPSPNKPEKPTPKPKDNFESERPKPDPFKGGEADESYINY